MIVVNPTKEANISMIECVLGPDGDDSNDDVPLPFDCAGGKKYLTETLATSTTDLLDNSFGSDISFNPPPTGLDAPPICNDESTLNWSIETLERTIDTVEDLDLNRLVYQPMEAVDNMEISQLRELVAMSLFLHDTATTSETPRSVIDAATRERVVSDNTIAKDLLNTWTRPIRTRIRKENTDSAKQESSTPSDESIIRPPPEEALPAIIASASLCLWSLSKMK